MQAHRSLYIFNSRLFAKGDERMKVPKILSFKHCLYRIYKFHCLTKSRASLNPIDFIQGK